MTELGNKHECLGCGAKFYDLGKTELICPKCGENQKELAESQDSTAGKKTSRKKKSAKAKPKKKKSPAKKTAKEVEEPAPEESQDADKKK